jgi:hypothetical protein
MRRSFFGLVAILVVSLVLVTGCQRADSLRVIKVNQGGQLDVDIADWALFDGDPELPDSEKVAESYYVFQSDTVSVELQYVEVGAGLPTWTPYEAIVTGASIKYKGAEDYGPDVKIPLSISVLSDREAKKTTKFTMTVVPAWWKEKYFGDAVEAPPDYNILDVVDATITFEGTDVVSGLDVEATGYLNMIVGNFYDDELTIGK